MGARTAGGGRLGTVATILAALVLAGVLAGYGDALNPTLALLADFRVHLGALAAALGVVAGILSLRRASGLAFMAAFAAAVGLGPVWGKAARPGTGREITLLYGNLWDLNPQPARLLDALRAANADILITSETMRDIADGGDGLRAFYPYHVVSLQPGATLRTAIWSRFPLRDGRLYLNNTVAPTGASAWADLGGGLKLGLIGGHFSRPGEHLRRAQTDALGPISQALPRPLAMVGDFNSEPWSWLVRHAAKVSGTTILGGYRVTWKGVYPTPLCPLPAPWGHQLDQALLSKGIGVVQAIAIPLPGSDHRGLWLRLRIPAS